MKALNPEGLQSILDSDLVWRRREMSTLLSTSQNQDLAVKHAIIRASVPLLYAHWEGFGKTCSIRYLEFVSFKRRKFDELKPSFTYLALGSQFQAVSSKPPAQAILSMTEAFLRAKGVNKDAFRKKVNTKSNLRFDVLNEMLVLCGIQTDAFDQHKNFIDEELCDPRNEIAHGDGSAPTFETLKRRRDRTFLIMDTLKIEYVNAALLGSYLA